MPAKSKTTEPFLVIPGLAIPSLSEPLEAVVATEKALEAVEKARAGLSSLKSELKAKTRDLEKFRAEVSGAGGKALAAARMGLAADDPAPKANAEASRAQIAALEAEIADIESAIEQAPDLFLDVQAAMVAARTELKDVYEQHVADVVGAWCAQATATLNAALQQVASVRSMSLLDARNSYGSSVAGAYADLGEFAQRASKVFVAADKEDRPLVPPPPPEPKRADDRVGVTQRYLEDPKEWEAKRQREEAAREAEKERNHRW